MDEDDLNQQPGVAEEGRGVELASNLEVPHAGAPAEGISRGVSERGSQREAVVAYTEGALQMRPCLLSFGFAHVRILG